MFKYVTAILQKFTTHSKPALLHVSSNVPISSGRMVTPTGTASFEIFPSQFQDKYVIAVSQDAQEAYYEFAGDVDALKTALSDAGQVCEITDSHIHIGRMTAPISDPSQSEAAYG